MTQFGQVVVGPPGSGKTTYCLAMAALLKQLGRKVAIVNLDPANEALPYEADVNITELVQLEEVMETRNLGPNAALLFCMEMLTTNLDWFLEKLSKLKDHYILCDFPGQAELYTHHTMVRDLLAAVEKANIRICTVFLIEVHYANDPGKFMSALLLALNSMLMLGTPTVNLLSKVDCVERYGKLHFGLDFYTDVLDLSYLLEQLEESPLTSKYRAMNKAIAEVVTGYSLVSFIPVSVDDRSLLINTIKALDKANGYVYGGAEERNIQRLLSVAIGAEFEHDRIGFARDAFTANEGEAEDDDEDVLRLIAQQNVGRE